MSGGVHSDYYFLAAGKVVSMLTTTFGSPGIVPRKLNFAPCPAPTPHNAGSVPDANCTGQLTSSPPAPAASPPMVNAPQACACSHRVCRKVLYFKYPATA
eukprot:gene18397-biopygen11458